MSIVSTFVSCPNIQDRLDNAFTKTRPNDIMEPIGLTDFLMSDLNRDGLLQEQSAPGNGKKRTVELVYRQRIPKSEVNESQTRICTSTQNLGEQKVEYSIDNDGVEFNWKVDITDLQTICQDNEDFVMDSILDVMNALFRRMEAKNMVQAAALIGSFASGESGVAADVKTVATKKASGDPNIEFIEEIAFAALNAGYPGVPIVIGWNEIWKAFKRLQATCCATDGLNIAEMAAKEGIVIIPSIEIPVALDTNDFITLAAGALQMIWFNEFDGPKGVNLIDDESYKQGILTHPTRGIPFDYIANNDCGVWHFQLKIAHKVVGMPSDMFVAGDDRLDGVTFVNEYTVVNP